MTKPWKTLKAILAISTAWLLLADVRVARGEAEVDYPTLDLVVSGGAVMPSRSDDGLAGIGPTFGAAALIGVTNVFALGLGADYTTLSWSRRFEERELSGSVAHTAISALIRVTMVRTPELETYARQALDTGT